MRWYQIGLAATLVMGLIGGCGGSDEPRDEQVYADVRAEFMGTATEGREIVVDHERIPDFMPSMMMTLPLADTSAVRGLEAGDKVAFDLIVSGASIRVENLRALPDTVTLDLPDEAASDTAAHSLDF